MPDSELSRAKELGFRYPPDHVSLDCIGYMGRVSELRGFISFFLDIVKGSQALAASLKEESRAAFENEISKYRLVEYKFSAHRQLVNEMMLSRSVESFDLYVLSMLRTVFTAKPEMLKSESSIDAATIIDLKDFNDIISYLAERKMHELSFKPLSELRAYIKRQTGIDLFVTEEIYEMTVLSSEVRNLIAHNDCRVNDLFLKRINRLGCKNSLSVEKSGKVIITDEWVRRASYALDGVVFDFDEAMVRKFGLATINPAALVDRA